MSQLIALDVSDAAAEALDRLASRLNMDAADVLRLGLSLLYRAHFPGPPKAGMPVKPNSPVPQRPTRHIASDVEEALEIADEIASLADEVPSAGQEFAESVCERTADIAATIEESGRVTEKQRQALENMRDGLLRWRDR